MMRPHGIGGSDAASAVGLDPYRSPVALWLEKTGRVESRAETEAMAWGKRLQPVLAAAVEEQGYAVMPAPSGTLDGPEDFMFGNVDGYCAGEWGTAPDGERLAYPDASRGVLELKTAGIFQAKHWDGDEIPLHYQAQGLHYLAVTGLAFCLFGVLIGGQRFALRRMERDEDAISRLIGAERDFWQYVERDEPPPVAWATSADLAAMFPDSSEGIVSLDDEPELIERLRLARAAVEVADASKLEAEGAIKARMGEAGTATLNGAKVATWKTQTAKRVNVKGLPAAVRDEFEYETTSRVFRVVA